MHCRPPSAHGSQVAGIEAFDDEGPVDNRQGKKGDGSNGRHQDQVGIIHRQNGAEQHVDEVDVAAAQGDDENAHGQRHKVDCSKARILP